MQSRSWSAGYDAGKKDAGIGIRQASIGQQSYDDGYETGYRNNSRVSNNPIVDAIGEVGFAQMHIEALARSLSHMTADQKKLTAEYLETVIYQPQLQPVDQPADGVLHSAQPSWPVSSGTPLIDLQNLLGDIWLYSDWAYVTRQLTTPQKELWLGAVAAWHKRLGPGEEFDADEWAWWRK